MDRNRIDKKKMLGVSLIKDLRHANPIISAKIGITIIPVAAPEMVEEQVVLAQALDSGTTTQAQIVNNVQTSAIDRNTSSNNGNNSGLSSGGSYIGENGNIWGQLSYGWGDVDRDNSSLGYSYDQRSVSLGVDFDIGGAFSLDYFGVFTSFNQTNSEVDSAIDADSEFQTYSLGMYSGTQLTPTLSLDVIGSIGIVELDTSRDTGFGIARGDTDGLAYSVATKLSYNVGSLEQYKVALTPYLALESHTLDVDGYSETGGGDIWRFDSATESRLASTLGVKLAKGFQANDLNVDTSFHLGWTHQYLDTSANTNVTLVAETPVAFSAESPEIARDSIRYGFGLGFSADDSNMAFYADVEGAHNADANNYLATVKFKYAW